MNHILIYDILNVHYLEIALNKNEEKTVDLLDM